MIVNQTEFRRALLDPSQPRPDGLTDGAGLAAGRRFDVYRNNVAVSLTEALEVAFPVIRKLLGDENFRILAGVFLRQHPPNSPLMMHYGTAMPAFLTGFEPTSSLQYLPDVARLELAMRASYHASDASPIDPSALQSMPPDQLMASHLHLAPALRLIRSRWPVHAIWRFNTEDDAPKPAMAAEDVLVLRPGLDPEPYLLPPGGGAFIDAILAGSPLGQAFEAAATKTPEFDLGQTLAILIAGKALTQIGD